MAEADDDDGSHHFLHLPPPPPPSPSPMRRRATSDTAANGGCGEIVEVQGGHIVRSIGRKDRHSKVCTAKGPRDRRVRLSAHTAIQFYDVQDRLGFDRPSKAVDWLIKKAKTSIDELAELPPWNPADAIRLAAANAKPRRTVAKSKISPSPPPPQNLQSLQFCGGFEGGRENPRFLPATMESDSISETMKSFFPVVAEAPSSQIMHNQDLSLSLQSFPDDAPPSLLHQNHDHSAAVAEPALFYGQSNPLGFDTSTVGWEQQSSEFGRIQRLVAWNGGETGNVGGGGGGFVFAPPPTSYQPILGQSQQLYSQRGPLQSSYTPMIRAWFDHPNHHHHQSISADDIHHHHHNNHHIPPQVQQAAIQGMRFASGEFSSGFRVPARFQGQEEELEDGLTNKPSSVSRH